MSKKIPIFFFHSFFLEEKKYYPSIESVSFRKCCKQKSQNVLALQKVKKNLKTPFFKKKIKFLQKNVHCKSSELKKKNLFI